MLKHVKTIELSHLHGWLEVWIIPRSLSIKMPLYLAATGDDDLLSTKSNQSVFIPANN